MSRSQRCFQTPLYLAVALLSGCGGLFVAQASGDAAPNVEDGGGPQPIAVPDAIPPPSDAGAPIDAAPHVPVCRNEGTRGEGWVWIDSDELIRWENCDDTWPICQQRGTPDEGWYRMDNGALIARASCAPADCPPLAPPAPGYCYGGTLSVGVDETGCALYKCLMP